MGMTYYVLTYEYCDRSGFHVCGVTVAPDVARAWKAANDDNKVYKCTLNEIAPWNEGHKACEEI